MKIVGLLLAAGRGRRFDPSGARNKLLATLPDGDPVVVASARKLLAHLSHVVAVVPSEDGVAAALRALGCDVTICDDADNGMAASLVHALRHSLPRADGWIIALGDMPHVAPDTIRALRMALEQRVGIAVPAHGGRRGNPVAFGAKHIQDLLALQGDQGARALLATCPVTEVPVADPGILQDIDIPSDLDLNVPLPSRERDSKP